MTNAELHIIICSTSNNDMVYGSTHFMDNSVRTCKMLTIQHVRVTAIIVKKKKRNNIKPLRAAQLSHRHNLFTEHCILILLL